MRWPWQRKTEERSISFQDLWGSGVDIDELTLGQPHNALGLAPVWAATRLIADSIAALPLQAFREAEGIKTQITTPVILKDPSIFGTTTEWVQRALTSLLLRGNAFGLITSFDGRGFPEQLEWLHPEEVTLANDERTTMRPQWQWRGRPVAPWLGPDSIGQLVHIPWYVMPGEILGLSPIQAFRVTIEGGLAAHRFGRDFFRNEAIPSAVLETEQKVDQQEAQLIKERFIEASKGRKPTVLGRGVKYNPITVAPDDSQFLETIRSTATTVASIYGVPPEMIGGETGSSQTYANVEQRALNLVQHTLRPYLVKLERHISTLLPEPQFARFNIDALVRADLKTRMESHKIAIDAGVRTVDEAREIEDLPPLPEDEQPEEPQPPQNGVAPVAVVTNTEEPDDD